MVGQDGEAWVMDFTGFPARGFSRSLNTVQPAAAAASRGKNRVFGSRVHTAEHLEEA